MGVFKRITILAALTVTGLVYGSSALAGVSVTPYVSVRSTKSVRPDKKNKEQENETIKQHQEYGVRFGVSFWRLCKFDLGLGQSQLTTTQKTSQVTDEYGEIDFEKDLNMDTSNPNNEIKVTETQRRARLSFILDPSFSIFILRAKIGVTAQQRLVDTEATGQEKQSFVYGPTYKPHSGVGFGVRFTPRMYAMAEYSAYHYKFPDIEPFERDLTVSYSISF